MKKHIKKQKKRITKSTEKSGYFLLILILLLTVISFYPSINNQFTNWDDTSLITENPLITELNAVNIYKIFSEPYFNNYQPLHILSYAIEYKLYGLNPSGYHSFSLLLHIVNTVLVFYFVKMLSRGNMFISLFTCLFFAIHPMHVESVAWASERKDLLYTLFFIISLVFYIRYIRENKNLTFYTLALVFFLLSAFSKAMAVSLVPVLLLLDIFERRKFNAAFLLDKLPFISCALIFGLLSVWSAADSIDTSSQYTFIDRIFFASNNLLMYLVKLVVPFELSAFYPYPAKPISWIYYASLPVVLLISGVVISQFKKRPYLFFGFGFFTATVFLVLMLIPVGPALFSERYTYIPSIGLFFVVGTFIVERSKIKISHLSSKHKLITACILFYALYLTVLTFQRCKVWENSFTLWENVVQQFPQASSAYLNLGDAHYKAGNNASAVDNFSKALQIYRDDKLAYYNRGNAYANMGEIAKANEDFSRSLSIDDRNPEAYNKRGATYAILGEWDKAVEDYKMAIMLNPDFSEVYYNLALGYYNNGDLRNACINFGAGANLGNTNCRAAMHDLCR